MTESRVVKVEHVSRRDGGVFYVDTTTWEESKYDYKWDDVERKRIPIAEEDQVWQADEETWTDTIVAVYTNTGADTYRHKHIKFDAVNELVNQNDIDAMRQLLNDIEESGVLNNDEA